MSGENKMRFVMYKWWHLWSDALGAKADVSNDQHSDLVAMIRTAMFVFLFITNTVIMAGVIRHWNDLRLSNKNTEQVMEEMK